MAQKAKSKAEIHADKGVELSLRKEYVQALTEFSLALRNDPKNSEARLGRAGILLDTGSPHMAAAELEKVLECDKDNIYAHYMKATVLTRLHDEKSAVNEFEAVIKLDPKNEMAYLSAAILCYDMMDYTKLIEIIGKAKKEFDTKPETQSVFEALENNVNRELGNALNLFLSQLRDDS